MTAPTLTAWTGRGLTGWISLRRAIKAFEKGLPDTMTPDEVKHSEEDKKLRKAKKEEKKRQKAARKAEKKQKKASKDAKAAPPREDAQEPTQDTHPTEQE